jgi:segregation and condensation protein B
MDLNTSETDVKQAPDLTQAIVAMRDEDPETIEKQMNTQSEDQADTPAEPPIESDGEEQAPAEQAAAEGEEEIAPEDDLAPEELPEPAEEVDPAHLHLLEALIFASVDPVPQHICKMRLPEGANVPALLARLRADYSTRGVNLMKIGKGWAFRTAAELAPQLATNREVTRKMSRAAVETLAVIAYHQPVTRAEIEEIRGVSISKGTMDVLFESGWIRPRGRRRTPGRPVTWGTSEGFLDHFGLESLDDLPGVEDLRAAGLLDKRPAIQTLGITDPKAPVDPDALPEPDEDAVDLTEDPLDPEDGDPRKLMQE